MEVKSGLGLRSWSSQSKASKPFLERLSSNRGSIANHWYLMAEPSGSIPGAAETGTCCIIKPLMMTDDDDLIPSPRQGLLPPYQVVLVPCPCSGSSTALPVTSTPAQPPRQKLQIHPACTGLALIPLKPLQAPGRGSQQLQTTALICDSLPCPERGEHSRGGTDRLLWPQRPRRTC